MAVDIRFIIDGADRGQPLNADEFGFAITENVEINARIVSFDNDLIFSGGMYQYLFGKLDQTGFCNLITVRVEYLCSGYWKKLVDGYIILSECNFDLDKCQLKCKVYDESFSTKINNNKGIPFSMSASLTKNQLPVSPPLALFGKFFNPATEVYDDEFITGVSVFDAFTHLVSCMSDNQIDFASTLFSFSSIVSDPSFLLLTNGDAIKNRSATETVISFETLYIALKKKLNLGISFEKQANGRPLLRIELATYYFQTGASANLYDQPSIDLTFDRSRLYQAVNFGSEPMLEKEACDGGNTACTFIQTPFRGFRNETFGFTGECNTSTILDLNTSEVVFDTNVIEDIFRFNSEEYKRNPVIVDCYWYSSAPAQFRANHFDPYSIGQWVYNGSLRNIFVSNSWISGYPNSLFSFLTSPTFPTNPDVEVRANYGTPPTFPIQFTTYNSYLTETGNYIEFPFFVSNPFNYYSGESYTCPYTGIYAVISVVCLADLGIASAGEHEGFCTIRHENNADVLIQKFDGPSSIIESFNGLVVSHAASFIANAGDQIKIDVSCRAVTANFGPQPIANSLFFPGTGNTVYTHLEVIGTPLNPDNPDEELQPVNIDDVRAYLYKFERPLTMGEIESILANTSKPITFGRYDDPLRVIPGYIKTLTVNSLIKQNAAIELKSNKILR
jgi:hypothetical protein